MLNKCVVFQQQKTENNCIIFQWVKIQTFVYYYFKKCNLVNKILNFLKYRKKVSTK